MPAEVFGLAAERVYGRRKLFLSGEGTLGLALASAKVGDQIWFLSGASVPFVLRLVPHASGRKGFGWVGEAYVHGY